MNKILGNLQLWQKLLLIIGSFVLPVGILAFFTFESLQENIDLARVELSGDSFNRPLADLLRDVAAHQLLLQRYLSGEKQLESTILTRQAQIDATFGALEQVNHRFGAALKFTASDLEADGVGYILPEKVRNEWLTLKAGWQQLTPERSEALHEHLITVVIAMIDRVDDTSDLTLDRRSIARTCWC